MAFEAQDLMVNVFPESDPWQMGPCDATTPPPAPCAPPSCKGNSAKAFAEEGVYLPALAALREQLQQTLRS